MLPLAAPFACKRAFRYSGEIIETVNDRRAPLIPAATALGH
jgi:hypothetical protein